jgi:putative hemolysin
VTALVVVLLLTLSASFLCSLLEAVLVSVPLAYISELVEEENPVGTRLSRIREMPGDALTALYTLNTIAHTLGAAVAGARAYQLWGDPFVAVFVLLLTIAVLLLAEVIPRGLGAAGWQGLAPVAAMALPLLVAGMRPVTLPLRWLGRAISGHEVERRFTPAEFEARAEIERRRSTLDEEEWEVVTNVMNLDTVLVGEVMTPRTDVVAISLDASVSDAIDLMLEEGHLRLPIFAGTIDRVAGVLLARDLWRASREGIQYIAEIVRPATFVPYTKPVDDLIRQMREQRIKMAIVLDEYGGTAGIVTLEDLIEEIIGEIQDEHEQEPLPFEEAMEGEIRIRGAVPLWEVNERFDLDLPDDVYDTLGGFVFGQLGRIPDVGDEVEMEGAIFRVVTMDGRRVTRVAYVAPPIRPADRG